MNEGGVMCVVVVQAGSHQMTQVGNVKRGIRLQQVGRQRETECTSSLYVSIEDGRVLVDCVSTRDASCDAVKGRRGVCER